MAINALVEVDTQLVNLPAAGASYLTTIAGNGRAGFSDGPGKLAEFNTPFDVVAVPEWLRTVYGSTPIRAFIADADNHRIRAVDVDGNVRTFAGGLKGFADGIGTAARFSRPRGIAIGPDGTLYLADTGDGTAGEGRRIRRIDRNGMVTTIAGTGVSGSADGPGDTATFNTIEGITVDAGGVIFVVDSSTHVVRKIQYLAGDPAAATSYQVTTVAGSAGNAGSADGTGPVARFKTPTGIAADSDGRLYVADSGNHTVRVLSRPASGATLAVTTLADLAGSSGTTDGTGSAARFNTPTGVSVDTAHNIYVTDFGSHRVRRVSPTGAVKTLIGSAAGFTNGANGRFNGPRHVSVETGGTLLVMDINNRALRSVQRLISEGQGE